jgi:hypothetical protein
MKFTYSKMAIMKKYLYQTENYVMLLGNLKLKMTEATKFVSSTFQDWKSSNFNKLFMFLWGHVHPHMHMRQHIFFF